MSGTIGETFEEPKNAKTKTEPQFRLTWANLVESRFQHLSRRLNAIVLPDMLGFGRHAKVTIRQPAVRIIRRGEPGPECARISLRVIIPTSAPAGRVTTGSLPMS